MAGAVTIENVMKRTVILSFTEKGGQLNRRTAQRLRAQGDVAASFLFGEDFTSTAALLSAEWPCTDVFVFIGAVGIAVRCIAPFLEDKYRDPAVLSMDENGAFVIPVLSGHVGGGVAYAVKTAGLLNAQPVITTATDTAGCFAVDVFAAENGLVLPDKEAVKEIAATLLGGGRILASCGAGRQTEDGGERYVSFAHSDGREICRMPFKRYVIGVGCKKGKSGEELYAFVRTVFGQYGLDLGLAAYVASVDVKKEEPGIWELARRLGVSYEVFSAAELEQTTGRTASSAFVKQTVGVDNVCETAALRLGTKLLVPKQSGNGMTVAVAALRPQKLRCMDGADGRQVQGLQWVPEENAQQG